MKKLITSLFLFTFTTLSASEFLVISPEGEHCLLKESAFNFGNWLASRPLFLSHPRHYYAEPNAEDIADIHFIVTFLANRSLVSIAAHKHDLEEAGDRINHIHPLRFLMAVFTHEERKVGIKNIRGKGWAWSHFSEGIKDTLGAEASIDNLKDEYIRHFSRTLGIDVGIIYPSLRAHQWEDFINLLIQHVPRQGDHDRYDA